MKKIFKAFGKLVGGILGNLDYVAAFALGALVQQSYPELLNDIYNALINFDYVGLAESTKGFALKVVDFAKESFEYFKGLIESKSEVAQ